MFVASLHKFICWDPNNQYDGIRWWDLWEVFSLWGWSPHDWHQSLYKKKSESGGLCSLLCEDIMRRWLSTNLEECSHQTLNLLTPWSQIFQFLELWDNMYFCCFSHVYIFMEARIYEYSTMVPCFPQLLCLSSQRCVHACSTSPLIC